MFKVSSLYKSIPQVSGMMALHVEFGLKPP
jgi:hypothetical protein